jgi:hyaluronate lyase
MKKIVYLSLFISSTAMATSIATPIAHPISTKEAKQSAAISNQENATEFDRLREKWREQMTGNSQATSLDVDVRAKFEQVHRAGFAQWQRMEKMEKSEQRTFLWQDQAQLGRKSEQLYSHYTRLKQMALAYASEGSALAGNPELLADLRSALQWLYQKNFYSPQTRAVDNW